MFAGMKGGFSISCVLDFPMKKSVVQFQDLSLSVVLLFMTQPQRFSAKNVSLELYGINVASNSLLISST